MEDCNAVISDCIILSCCCQCLILRLVVFVFFQVPRKVARKMKEYAKRKLRKRRNKKQSDGDHVEIVDRSSQQIEDYDNDDDDDKEFNMTMRILELEEIGVNEMHKWGSCEEEVEKVLGELSLKGEFGFGSFWRRNSKIKTRNRYCKCSSNSRSLTKEEDEIEFGGSHVVKLHLIEVIGQFSAQ